LKRTKYIVFSILLGLSIFCSTLFLWAQSSIVKSAQDLALDQNREGIYNLINKHEDQIKASISEMTQLNRLAEVFFTELGQNRYSSGLSVLGSDPKLAYSRFAEAYEMEKNHQKSLHGMAVAEIQQLQCSQAKTLLVKHLLSNPVDGEAHLLLAMAYLCMNQWAEADKVLSQLEQLGTHSSDERLFILRIRIAEKREILDEKNKVLEKANQKIQIFSAEKSWYRWLLAETAEDRITYAEEYILRCKKFLQQTYRKEPLFPLYCSETSLVEKELAVLKREIQQEDVQ
tara:strand:- start:77775 stop:78632 length:858 start_codon:yes stop_codon:yes gene_type:complete